MSQHGPSTSFAFAFFWTALAACGGSATNPLDAGALSVGAPGGGPAKEAGAPVFADGGAPTSNACVPSPKNYEVPGNGCDDDADGTVDVAAQCDAALPVTGDAAAFARALRLCRAATPESWGVVSATYTRGFQSTAAPAEGQHGILPSFGHNVKPREGAALGVLSTGWAREFDGPSGAGIFQGGQLMTGPGTVPPGYPKPAAGCEIASEVHDVISVALEIKAPSNARGLSFDFNFYSGEWPQYVCTRFNDGFAAFLRSSAFNGGASDNISYDANNNPVSVNNGFFDRCTPNTTTGCEGGPLKTASCAGGESELAGTGFAVRHEFCGNRQSTGGGATGWLTSQAAVAPGETIVLQLTIWDTGDERFDSSVLVDNLTWAAGATETKTERPK